MTDEDWYSIMWPAIETACTRGSLWFHINGLTIVDVSPAQDPDRLALTISTTTKVSPDGYSTIHNTVTIPKTEIPGLIEALQEAIA